MANASVVDIGFEYFIKKVLTLHFACPELKLQTFEVLPQMPSPHPGAVTDALIEKFVKALWFKAQVAFKVWNPLLTVYSGDVLESNHSYLTSLLYMCQFVHHGVKDYHEGLTSIIATVAAAAVFFHKCGQSLAFEYAAPVLITYFDTELRTQFYDMGGWRGLDHYITNKYYLKLYNVVRSSTDDEVLKDFERYLQYCVTVTEYQDCIEYIIPDHIKYDYRCNLMAVELIKHFFPKQIVTPRNAELNTLEIEGAMENLELSQPVSSEALGTVSPRAQDPESVPADHHSCPHRRLYPFVDIPAEAADTGSPVNDLARLAEIEKSKLLRLRSVLYDLKCNATRMLIVLLSFDK